MKTEIALCGAALCVALAGCAGTPPRPMSRAPCNQAVCFISVSVTNCSIDVDDPERQIAKGNREAKIIWDLDTSSALWYRFTDDGISWKTPGDQFHSKGHSALGGQFHWTDRNDTSGKFEYGINVTRRFGGDCPPKDPFVVNG